MSLGASNDAELCRDVGAAVARAVKALGFNWNFAPVLDVNNNMHNPVIAERSFGSDPQRVIALAQAWMQGSLDEGVACCIKHFPGHGDTHVDSHRALPTVDKSAPELDALELAPFRALAPQAPAIMSAHIVYPALDPIYPATMSHTILTKVLREQWGYDGVVITDGMEMQAIAGQYGVGNAAALALKAGADIVMALGIPETQEQTIAAMVEAIIGGDVDLNDLKIRLARIQKLTQDFPCMISDYSEEATDMELMRVAWQRGLTTYKQPIAPALGQKIRLIMRADAVSDGVSEVGIHCAKLMTALSALYEVALCTFSDPDEFVWSALPADGRVNVLASTVRARYSEKVRNSFHPDLHLVLWNPYVALDIDAPALITFGFVTPAIEAVTGFLRGEIGADGVMPVRFE
jgi:beta-N-acetylhexosaminidase